MNPMFKTDGYKLDHRRQYPEGTEFVYSNVTPRSGRDPESRGVIFFGLQHFLQKFNRDMADNFFAQPLEDILNEYQDFVDSYLGPNGIGTDHIAALWRLGYIPLEFRALPEGSFVPYGVPVITVENTLPEFFWLTNYFETLLASETWHPITSATTAFKYRKILDHWANETSDTPEFVDWQGHDFSFRGMSNADAAAISGAAHLLFFTGTDTIPAIKLLQSSYAGEGLVGGSVAATEHSVMCADGLDGELGTVDRLLNLYPSGILSVVSDSFNLWTMLTEYLPQLKDKIMSRDGKFVVRPDSGNPVDILCGDAWASPVGGPAFRGVIELLWDVFGGTINSRGYKVLDPHVGAIYGDSITPERSEAICAGLEQKGFASTNVVFGIGSFTYQYVTRDTHGLAMKTTAAVVNGVERSIYKKPATDDGGKFSARGRLAVRRGEDRELFLIEGLDWDQWNKTASLLKPVFVDGKFLNQETLSGIRGRVRSELLY